MSSKYPPRYNMGQTSLTTEMTLIKSDTAKKKKRGAGLDVRCIAAYKGSWKSGQVKAIQIVNSL